MWTTESEKQKKTFSPTMEEIIFLAEYSPMTRQRERQLSLGNELGKSIH